MARVEGIDPDWRWKQQTAKPVNKAQTVNKTDVNKPRKTSTEAFKRWRERNRDKWREYHTNYMRNYRAAKKASA